MERRTSPVTLNSSFHSHAADALRLARGGCLFLPEKRRGGEGRGGKARLERACACSGAKSGFVGTRAASCSRPAPPFPSPPHPTPSSPDPLSFPRSSLPL